MVIFGVLLIFLCNISGILSQHEEHFEDNYNMYRDWTLSDSPEQYRRIEAAIFKGHMNETADPCEDFFEYACGNWGRRHQTESGGDFDEVVRPYHWHFLSNLLSEDVAEEDSQAHAKLKQFYVSCMNRGTGSLLNSEEMHPDIGQWPSFEEYILDDELDWVGLTARFHRFGVEIFFNIVESDQGFSFSIPVYYVEENFTSYEESQLNTFGYLLEETRVNDTTDEELFKFEELLGDQRKTFTDNGTTFYDQISVAISEIPSVNFSRYLRIVYGNDNFEDSAMINVKDQEYYEPLSQLIASTNPRVVINYMIKRYIEVYSGLISLELSDTEHICAEWTARLMEPAVSNLIYNRVIGEEGQQVLDDLAERMIAKVAGMIEESAFLEASDKAILLEKEFKLQFVGPAYMLDNKVVDELFSDLVIDSEDYIQNLVVLFPFSKSSFLRQKEFLEPNEFYYKPMMESLLQLVADFVVEWSLPYLLPPHFHKYSPGFSKFGLVGSALGHELVHAYDNNVFLDENQGVNSTFSDKFRREYPERAECFNLQYTYRGEELSQSKKYDNTGEHIANVVGRRLAVSAYKDWLREQSIPEHGLEDDIYAGLGLNNIQLFFLAQAQFACQHMSDQYYIDEARKGTITDPPNMKHTNSKVDDFLNAFNCPAIYDDQCKYFD